jgi:hypothetical protein
LTLRQIKGIREVLDLLNAISVNHPQFVIVRSEPQHLESCVPPFSLHVTNESGSITLPSLPINAKASGRCQAF